MDLSIFSKKSLRFYVRLTEKFVMRTTSRTRCDFHNHKRMSVIVLFSAFNV